MADEMKPSELWAEIIALPRPSRVIEFPRKKPDGTPVGEFSMQVLKQEEQMLCAAAAERFTRKLLKDDAPKNGDLARGYNDIYSNAAAVEILFRACRTKDDLIKPLFPSPDVLRQNLTNDELGVLMSIYYTVQTELGPIVAYLSEEEIEAWIARLVEGGSSYPLDSLSSEAQKQLLMRLASRLYKPPTDTSLPGSPAEEGATNSLPSETA